MLAPCLAGAAAEDQLAAVSPEGAQANFLLLETVVHDGGLAVGILAVHRFHKQADPAALGREVIHADFGCVQRAVAIVLRIRAVFQLVAIHRGVDAPARMKLVAAVDEFAAAVDGVLSQTNCAIHKTAQGARCGVAKLARQTIAQLPVPLALEIEAVEIQHAQIGKFCFIGADAAGDLLAAFLPVQQQAGAKLVIDVALLTAGRAEDVAVVGCVVGREKLQRVSWSGLHACTSGHDQQGRYPAQAEKAGMLL